MEDMLYQRIINAVPPGSRISILDFECTLLGYFLDKNCQGLYLILSPVASYNGMPIAVRGARDILEYYDLDDNLCPQLDFTWRDYFECVLDTQDKIKEYFLNYTGQDVWNMIQDLLGCTSVQYFNECLSSFNANSEMRTLALYQYYYQVDDHVKCYQTIALIFDDALGTPFLFLVQDFWNSN